MKQKYKLNKKQFESNGSKITGKEVLINGGLEPIEDYELLLKVNEGGFEPIQLDEIIDLKDPGIEGFFAKSYKKLKIIVDDKEIDVEECFMTATEILETASINPEDYFLIQLKGDNEIGYKNDKQHKIGIKNNSRFKSCELEIIDIEDHCKNNKKVPKDCRYKIKVDRDKYLVNTECLTGKEILILAGKVPHTNHQLNQKINGTVKKIDYDEKVDFTCPGIERFMTLPLDQTEG